MKIIILLASIYSGIFLYSNTAFADKHLELGLETNTVFINDAAYEAFSPNNLYINRYGLDLRVEVLTIKKNIHLLPVISYRHSQRFGNPYNILETNLKTHDFAAGLRLRSWLKSWLGGFAQVSGGVMLAQMTATTDNNNQAGMKNNYSDDHLSWEVSGLLGAEARISPDYLAKKNIKNVNLGVEISGGYIRRGKVSFKPSIDGGDEHSLDIDQTSDWGSLNLSGWLIQFGITLSFF